MKMNKYECKCSDTVCKLESNKRPTFCPYYSHISPDWSMVNEKENDMQELTTWDKLPVWIKDSIKDHLRWAVDKHPIFPSDPFQAMCIIQEELGEAIQALNNLKHHQQGYSYNIYGELFHTIVTCIRTIDTMAKNEFKE